MAVYTQIDNPELYMQCKNYTGTGSSQAQTFDGDEDMQPDMVWIKQRSGVEQHVIFDSVRGVQKYITPNTTAAEGDTATTLTAFGSDGFTEGGHGITGGSSGTYAAWCWKANGSGSANTDGSINTTKTSANTTSGFSIVQYDPDGTDPSTYGHGLGAVPKVILTKVTDESSHDWKCYFEAVGNDKVMQLSVTAAEASSDAWNATTPTSTLFTCGNDGATNGSGRTIIAYCFAEKQGFSKFGSWTGNANANGPFVYTGFKPAWVMWKHTSDTYGWYILNNKSDTYNPEESFFYANSNAAEADNTFMDFLSNGFKIRESGGGSNGSGASYVYMAFAEAPFVNSNGVPCTAR